MCFISFFILQVIDFERDFEQVKLGEKTEKDIPYRSVLGLKKDLTGAEVATEIIPDNDTDSEKDTNEGRYFTEWITYTISLNPVSLQCIKVWHYEEKRSNENIQSKY